MIPDISFDTVEILSKSYEVLLEKINNCHNYIGNRRDKKIIDINIESYKIVFKVSLTTPNIRQYCQIQ